MVSVSFPIELSLASTSSACAALLPMSTEVTLGPPVLAKSAAKRAAWRLAASDLACHCAAEAESASALAWPAVSAVCAASASDVRCSTSA
ncbi:hypothetical protein ACFJGV_17740 [Cnuibacter sp. UC19_7]|uniref:hypothetical protein n=1 Tax=Cnuibacter sp. UC19_7 TaxID=3350166 RepID=UPI00366C62E0